MNFLNSGSDPLDSSVTMRPSRTRSVALCVRISRRNKSINPLMPGGDMIEAELVSEDRLARPRVAPHDINACFEKASSQNGVETRDAGRHALKWRLPGGIDWIGSHGVPYVGGSGRIKVKVDTS